MPFCKTPGLLSHKQLIFESHNILRKKSNNWKTQSFRLLENQTRKVEARNHKNSFSGNFSPFYFSLLPKNFWFLIEQTGTLFSFLDGDGVVYLRKTFEESDGTRSFFLFVSVWKVGICFSFNPPRKS